MRNSGLTLARAMRRGRGVNAASTFKVVVFPEAAEALTMTRRGEVAAHSIDHVCAT